MRSSIVLAAAAALFTLTVVVDPAAQGGPPQPQGRGAPPAVSRHSCGLRVILR